MIVFHSKSSFFNHSGSYSASLNVLIALSYLTHLTVTGTGLVTATLTCFSMELS